MKLSVLDTQHPAHLPELVPELERLEYHRYWATEHHSPQQSASPTIVAGLAAGVSDRIRVGTAGVLLRAAAALRVTEDFATLELFFPGRIDLGIAGAMPSGPYMAELQRDVAFPSNEAYTERIIRLLEMVRRRTLPSSSTPIGPQSYSRPQIWLCGTSIRAARLAGSLGMSFAFHHHLASADQGFVPGIGDAYRASFVAVDGGQPRLLVAAYGHCATSDDHAHNEWDEYFGGNAPSPSFVGTPERVRDRLAELAEGYGADELAIDCFAPSFESRLAGLASIKNAVDALSRSAA